MYFSMLPEIAYDTKPVSYPFSESDRVIAKNFFRRYKVNEDIFSSAILFQKYIIRDGERPDMVAEKAYGDRYYDWIVLLTNNLVNVQYDWPLSNYELGKVLEKEFTNPYGEIHHYETTKIAQYPAGLHVDETFYNKQHKLNINGTITLKYGYDFCSPVTVAAYYDQLNEKKREIYLIKGTYIQSFVNDFRKQNTYKKSSDYINKRLKQSS